MAIGMKRADYTGFLRRGNLGEDRRLFGKLGQCDLAHRFDVWAKRDAIHFKPNLAADLADADFVVAGDNLDRDEVRPLRTSTCAGPISQNALNWWKSAFAMR
jgi:hypothetical protein